MTLSTADARAGLAWNAGRHVGIKKPLKQRQIRHPLRSGPGRADDRSCIVRLAIDSKLRGCDLAKIKIGTLVAGKDIRTRGVVVQQKTGRPVHFEITNEVMQACLPGLSEGRTVDEYAFHSRVDHTGQLTTRRYDRLVGDRVIAIGFVGKTVVRLFRDRHTTFQLLAVNYTLFGAWVT